MIEGMGETEKRGGGVRPTLLHFLQYHNAVPIAIGIVVLGAGGVFAATNPEAIYSAEEAVVAVDNTYIAGKDLSGWSPHVRIAEVTEDAENYYVAYTFSTIALQDYVWQDVQLAETMTVSKADLGPYRDLGVYVMGQLKQAIAREIAYLKEVQEIERKSVTQKTVAVSYGGLVGGILDDKTEVLPGYTPVVEGPPPAAQGSFSGASTNADTGSSGARAGGSGASPAPSGTIAVQVLGKNPARIPVGSRYADLGAFAQSSSGESLLLDVFLDGIHMSAVSIDTSKPGTYAIRYETHDSAGNTGSASRTVIVYDPYEPQEPEEGAKREEGEAASQQKPEEEAREEGATVPQVSGEGEIPAEPATTTPSE